MSFPPTHVSAIRRVASPDVETRARALDVLASVYWRPIYLHIRLSHAAEPADAEDLTQAFFEEALRRDLFARFDAARGRFRSYIRTCVDSFVANERKADRRLKRGGVHRHLDVDTAGLEALATDADPDAAFHEEWVRRVFHAAADRLRAKYAAMDRTKQFEVFASYDLSNSEARSTYAEAAARAGVPLTTVTNWLSAARRDFRAEVLATLRDLSGSDEEFRDEARALLGVPGV